MTKFFAPPCRVDGARIYDAQGDLVATVAYRRDKADEQKAVALIAAAPKLLAACQKFMDGISILNDGPDDSDVAHAQKLLVESFTLARDAVNAANPSTSAST